VQAAVWLLKKNLLALVYSPILIITGMLDLCQARVEKAVARHRLSILFKSRHEIGILTFKNMGHTFVVNS
jgi:hypothetical protein